MALIKRVTTYDEFGAPHSVTTIQCDGPECHRTVTSDDVDKLASWGTLDLPQAEGRADLWLCSTVCLIAWVATEYELVARA